MNIVVSDKAGNKTEKTVLVMVTGEKRLQNGKWINYDEFGKVKIAFKKACENYGTFGDINCFSNDSIWDLFFNNVNLEVRYDPYRNLFCEYNAESFEPYQCIENGGSNFLSNS